MLASGFARLSIDLNLEVVDPPLDVAGDAGAASCKGWSEATGPAVARDASAGSCMGGSEASGSAVARDAGAASHMGGPAARAAKCLRAQDAKHLQDFALVEAKNEVNGAMVKAHVPFGQMDVCRAETEKGNLYRQALWKRSLLDLYFDPDQALRKC